MWRVSGLDGWPYAKAHQRQGIGKTLLVAAMGKFIEIFNSAGGIGLFVDAKDQDAKRYYEQFGFVSHALQRTGIISAGQNNPGGTERITSGSEWMMWRNGPMR